MEVPITPEQRAEVERKLRRAGRPVGAKDSYKRAPYRRKQNLPAQN